MFKTCPQCGDEFVQHVESCPDCRVRLLAPGEAPPPRAAASTGATPSDAPVLLRRGTVMDLRDLGAQLAANGIAFAVDSDATTGSAAAHARAAGREVQLALYVHEADAPAAARVAQAWVVANVPDAEHVEPGTALDACPGCGEPLPEEAAACASCGLEFPPLEVSCPRCGQAAAVDAANCPSCGYRP
jgi:hypothetical protein